MSLYEQRSRFLTVKFGGVRGEKGIGIPGSPGGGARSGYVELLSDFVMNASSPATDIPGMQLTITATGKPFHLVVKGQGLSELGTGTRAIGINFLEAAIGSPPILGIAGAIPSMLPTAGSAAFIDGDCWITPTPGVHTYKLQATANYPSASKITFQTKAFTFGIKAFYFSIQEG